MLRFGELVMLSRLRWGIPEDEISAGVTPVTARA
jgi:hypothetical protein